MNNREVVENLIKISRARVAYSERRLHEDKMVLAYLEGVLGSMVHGQTNIDDFLLDWNYDMKEEV